MYPSPNLAVNERPSSLSDLTMASDRSIESSSLGSSALGNSAPKRYHSKSSKHTEHQPLQARSALFRSSLSRRLGADATPFLEQLDRVPLVGRTAELQRLQKILHQTSTTPAAGGSSAGSTASSGSVGGPLTHVLWVSGLPGCGKSTTVSQLKPGGRATVTHNNARLPLQPLFGQGKFDAVADSQQGTLPFSGFVAAMDELVQAIQALSLTHPVAYLHLIQQLRQEFPRQTEQHHLSTVVSQLDVLLQDEREEEEARVEPPVPVVIKALEEQPQPNLHSSYISSPSETLELTAIDTITEEGGESFTEGGQPTVYPLTNRWAHLRNLPNQGESSEKDTFSQCFEPATPADQASLSDNVVFDADRSKNVLYFLLRRFLKVISLCALHGHPVIIVLDDMQWADQDSLDLFAHLATDRQSSGLLLVGTYRSNEEDFSEALQACIQAVSESQVHPVTRMSLNNLLVEDVQAFLEELFSSDAHHVRELAAVIHSKTSGNPFYFRQFIMSLNDEELLSFDATTYSWKFNVEKIRSEMSIADNLASMVLSQIRSKVHAGAQFILQMASCLGNPFDEGTVTFLFHDICERACTNSDDWIPAEFADAFSLFYNDDTEAIRKGEKDIPSIRDVSSRVSTCLDMCVAKGLLESLTETGTSHGREYRFAHDHIQLAVSSLIEVEERGRLQLLMGELLLDEMPGEDSLDTTSLFTAADLMNRGLPYIPKENLDKRLSLVRLNLRAGKTATKLSAFSSALAYLRAGIGVLKDLGSPEVYWAEHKTLCLELFGFASDASFCHGKLEEMQIYIDEVLAQTNLSFVDKLRAHCTHVHALGTQNKLLEAIDESLYLLEQLGTYLPKNPSQFGLVASLIKTKRLVEKHGKDSILALPRMEDAHLLTEMRIMDNLATYAYAANPELLVVVILKMTRRSVKYGVSPYSPTAFGGFANLLGSVLGNYRKGNIYAKVCLDLNKQMGLREMRARSIFVSHNFSMHWNEPLPQSFKPYLRGYNYGLETGDLENAMFCITYHCDVAMHTGRPLSSVVADYAAYTQQMKDFELEYNFTISLVPWQLGLNLMGDCSDPLVLTGKAMEQQHMLDAGETIPFLRSITNAARLCLACLFNEYKLAWDIVEGMQDLAKTNLGQHVVWRSSLFEGLAAFGLFRETGKRVWKVKAVKVIKRVQTWVTEGNLNCVHILYILEAEKSASESNNHEKVRRAYDKAISSASRIGFSNDQALANEKAGIYFAEDVGGESGAYWARHYFESSLRLYNSWEAYGKSKDLLSRYPHFVSDGRTELVPDFGK